MSLDGLRLVLVDISYKLNDILDAICEPSEITDINHRLLVWDLAGLKQVLHTEIVRLMEISEEEEAEIMDELLGVEDGSDD